MPHEFEVREEILLEATPEEVWQAIATGPGVDSWFMGRNEFEPREGGATRQTIMGHTEEATITSWEPGKRLAYRSDPTADGTFMAFEYLIEGRDHGSTVLRFVHSGFLDDDWESQYDALKVGDGMYLRKLALYLKHFPGRVAGYNLFAVGPHVSSKDQVWAAFHSVLGVDWMSQTLTAGDKVRLAVEGLDPAEGVVEWFESGFMGVRTADAIYLFLHGYMDTVVVEMHGFADDHDGDRIERAWQAWFERTFA